MKLDRSSTFGPSALLTPANAVTALRLVISPTLWFAIVWWGASWMTFAIWGALTASDVADGWVARRQGTTRSGAFLDPLADKALILGALVALVFAERFWWLPVAVIGVREGLVSFWRTRLGARGVSVPASNSAKLKTAFQAAAVGAAVCPSSQGDLAWLADVLLAAAVTLTVVSGLQYLLAGYGGDKA